MSRSAAAALKAAAAADGGGGALARPLPPSHPAEQYEEHRAFLARSLERSDREIAALIDLTRSLRAARRAVVDTCGELTLLDLGAGTIRLAPTGDSLVLEDDEGAATPPPPHLLQIQEDVRARELCVDFLLRLKLRRRLLSRVFRRLNRVANAMDGNDVAPPVPPRYGDLRLHIEPSEVASFQEHWARQEAALLAMSQQKEVLDKVPVEDETDAAAPVSSNSEATEEERPNGAKSSSNTQEVDYAALMSFKDGYEKLVHPETGAIKYTLLDQTHEEDYAKIKYGTGIGAVQRNMSLKEKESEFKRWQSAILSRIPEQPSYADLNLEHRVFYAEERRKRALEAAKESTPKKRANTDDNDERTERGRGGKSLRKMQEEKDAKDTEGQVPVEDSEDKEATGNVKDATVDDVVEGTVDQKSDVNSGDDAMETEASGEPTARVNNDNEEANEIKENETENPEQITKKMHPISLCPVPSFHDQDMRRIRMIQSELLSSSMQSQGRQRLEEAIREYNQVLRASQEAARRRQQVDSRLQQMIFETKRLQGTHHMKNSAAHANWLRKVQAFNNEKLNQTLKSRWNQTAQGSDMTKWYMNQPSPLAKDVASCLADVIDAVEMIADGKLVNPKFNEPFVPPPLQDVDPSTGESNLLQAQRMQHHLKNESDALIQKFRLGEEERQRAWRRMLKVKAELRLSQYIISNQRRVSIQLTEQNYHMLMMPPINQAMPESLPREYDGASSVVPSYIPAQNIRITEPSSGSTGSESKYAIARVRARISADGSVAPVTQPKRGADGLFARPAGRTRKGMDWDAVNGVWRPL